MITQKEITSYPNITPSQQKQIGRLIEDGLDDLNLSKESAQRLIEKGGQFQGEMKELVRRLSYRYPGEEPGAYLPGGAPKSVADQVARLREFFPELGSYDEAIERKILPKGADGWFAIPRWKIFGDNYGQVILTLLDLLKRERGGKFQNYRAGQLRAGSIRQSKEQKEVFGMIERTQKGHDILIIPAQFGSLYRGLSASNARKAMSKRECGLGAFAVGIMILLNQRLINSNDLWINCAGDEFFSAGIDSHSQESAWMPCFGFDGMQGWFGTREIKDESTNYGSASCFLTVS